MSAESEKEVCSEAWRAVGPCEPLWLFCPKRGIGGQAALREVSPSGIRIAVDSRYGWRLARALRDAEASAALVEVARLPRDRHRQGRVVWIADCAAHELQVELMLTEPLVDWPP
jgi:hypothetical protein